MNTKKRTLAVAGAMALALTLLPSTSTWAADEDAAPVEEEAPVVTDSGDEVILEGKVTAATDTDGDGTNDQFKIDTGGSIKTVTNTTEQDDFGLVQVGDTIEVEVTVEGSGLKLVNIVAIS